ncbi:MAG: hypothetical protein ACHQQ3_03085 [Gemmatimonadales bacterium]
MLVLLVLLASPVAAQKPDSLRRAAPDSGAVSQQPSLYSKPPVSPRRAFLYSALVPGLGQASLDRPYTGLGFFVVEVISLSLVHRSAEDLRIAKAFFGDSVPLTYAIDAQTGIAQRDGNGNPVVATWQRSGYNAALLQARQLQLEDWVAVVIFNHLISGAEAFVSAQLWDLPQHVKMRAFSVPRGAGLGVSARFR